jgi:hypothetical protein
LSGLADGVSFGRAAPVFIPPFQNHYGQKNWALAFQKKKGTTSIAAERVVARDNLLPF